MEHLRKKIDTIDTQIVGLVAKRQSCVLRIGEYKKENGVPVFQPKRERAIIKSKKVLAKKFGLKPSLVEKIFKLIIANSREIQKKTPPKF